MDNRKLVGLLGSGLLAVGVFAPLIRVPIVGSINYFRNGQGDGMIVLILALVALVLVLRETYRWLLATATLTTLVVGYTFISFQSRMAQTRADMGADLVGNPFRGIAEAMVGSIQMEWGWALLVIGVIMHLIVATDGPWDKKQVSSTS